jgi:hypothetical protein
MLGVAGLAVSLLTASPGGADELLEAARRQFGSPPEAGARTMPAPVSTPAPIAESIGAAARTQNNRDERSLDDVVKAAAEREALDRIAAIAAETLAGFDPTSFDRRFNAAIRKIDTWLKASDATADPNE